MCDKYRRDCETCKDLIDKYGVDELDICERCGHFFHGEKCNCLGIDKERG